MVACYLSSSIFFELFNTFVTRVLQVGYGVMHCVYLGHTVFVGRLSGTLLGQQLYLGSHTLPRHGYLNENSMNKVQGVINRFKRYGYRPADREDFSVICDTADNRLFII